MILVSAQGPNSSFFFFCGTFIRLGDLFGHGLGLGLGPGLDNIKRCLMPCNQRNLISEKLLIKVS